MNLLGDKILLMIQRIRTGMKQYPPQFWLLFAGYLISTVGSSMIWPFLMIYASERLRLPMTMVASLMAINAMAGLIPISLAGPIVDRLGRKWVMVISLIANGLGYIFLSQASTFLTFAIAMGINGAVNPLYRVGADAMMADLLPEEKRVDGYALMRLSNNLGVAIGPAIGGFLVAASYFLAFYLAAAGMCLYGLMLLFFAVETLPQFEKEVYKGEKARSAGYGPVLQDKPFLSFVGAFTVTQVSVLIVWVLLGVYLKKNYGVPESLYGWLPTTNALLIVLTQIYVTSITKRYAPMMIMTLGALLYAVAAGGIVLGTGFWWFWFCMVVLTFGEMTLIPTASTYTANRAPADMRGRYMSVYWWSSSIAIGVGPVLGGWLNDSFGPKAIWYGAGVIGLAAVAWFYMLGLRARAVPGLEEI